MYKAEIFLGIISARENGIWTLGTGDLKKKGLHMIGQFW